MKLRLSRAILTAGNRVGVVYDIEKDALGEPVGFVKDGAGNITHFDMIFYGYSNIFKSIRTQDLEIV